MVLAIVVSIAYAYLTAGFGEIVCGAVDGSERTVISKQEQNLWAFATMGFLFVIGAGVLLRQLMIEKGHASDQNDHTRQEEGDATVGKPEREPRGYARKALGCLAVCALVVGALFLMTFLFWKSGIGTKVQKWIEAGADTNEVRTTPPTVPESAPEGADSVR